MVHVIHGIINHYGMRSNMLINTWDADNEKFISKYAINLIQVNSSCKKIPQDPKLWKDEFNGDTENLWLNLSTGYIGGGRKNWDGSGGSGSALQHYIDTGRKYPLCVKMGTITPHGADVWSYASDEDALVIDPKLSEHLSFWGIDIMKTEKTEKTMGELEVELNKTYDWSKILDGSEEIEMMDGPGYKGLRNIGSSCYMNAVVQTMLAVQEVRDIYINCHEAIIGSSPSDAASDIPVQFSKLAVGLYSLRYILSKNKRDRVDSNIAVNGEDNNDSKYDSKYDSNVGYDTKSNSYDDKDNKDSSNDNNHNNINSNKNNRKMMISLNEDGGNNNNNNNNNNNDLMLEKYIISPYMFKHIISHGNHEFSSGRQQDVSEYYQYLLQVIAKTEKIHYPRYQTTINYNTIKLFEFHIETRIQCLATGDVKYGKFGQQSLYNLLELRVPTEKAIMDSKNSSNSSNSSSKPITMDVDVNDVNNKRPRIDIRHDHNNSNSNSNSDEKDEKDESSYEFIQKSDIVESNNTTTTPSSSSTTTTINNTTTTNTPIIPVTEIETFIPFIYCLDTFIQPEIIEMFHPTMNCNTSCVKTLRFKTFPKYLMMKMGRYYVSDNWTQKKITSRIDVPELLDLSSFKATGLLSHETLMGDDDSDNDRRGGNDGSNNVKLTDTIDNVPNFQVDNNLVDQLTTMGFSENGCKRAAIATNNGNIDMALNWILEHMEDPDFNDSPTLPSSSSSSPSYSSSLHINPEAIDMLVSMGYTEDQTKAALIATDQDIERAADWLFSHVDDLDYAVAQILASKIDIDDNNNSSSNKGGQVKTEFQPVEDHSEGRYTLMAIISHIGKSTDHGHYVCHIKKDADWILYNDEKVGKCSKAPIEYGFMYLYKRDD